MAFEIGVAESPSAAGDADSLAESRDPLKPRFDPMRRKLHIGVDA
jgi:hypothetical protein